MGGLRASFGGEFFVYRFVGGVGDIFYTTRVTNSGCVLARCSAAPVVSLGFIVPDFSRSVKDYSVVFLRTCKSAEFTTPAYATITPTVVVSVASSTLRAPPRPVAKVLRTFRA